MPEMDVDALREARDEVQPPAEPEPRVLSFKGQKFVCVPELTLDMVDAIREDRTSALLRLMLGDEPITKHHKDKPDEVLPSNYERFRSLSPTMRDVAIIVQNIGDLYGVGTSKSEASAPRSNRATRRAKPTSKRSTA